MTKKRYDEIDIMRIMGFLMVVDQHILGAYAQRPEASFSDSMVLHFFYLLGRPAVAMFVAITGFTLFHVNYRGFKAKGFYKKRMVTIVAPYLFWSFATIFIFHKYDMLKNIAAVLITGTASYHLWYMGMSIRIYLWFPLILTAVSWLMKRSENTRRMILVLFCITYWLLLKGNNFIVDNVSAWIFGTPSLLQKRFIQYTPILWSIYFALGVVAWSNYEGFKEKVMMNWRKILIIYVPLVAYMYYTQVCYKLPANFPRISYEHALYILYMIATILLVYVLSVKISERVRRFKGWLLDIASLSYGAYLVHVIVLERMAEIIRRRIPVESYLLSGLMIFAATSVISFAICYFIRFLPLSRYIIGVNRMPLPFIGKIAISKDKGKMAA